MRKKKLRQELARLELKHMRTWNTVHGLREALVRLHKKIDDCPACHMEGSQ